MDKELNTSGYANWFKEIKEKGISARQKASLAINSVLMELYWDLGKEIASKEKQAKWGSGFIEKLSIDLKLEFPEITGFSRRNLYAIRQWYLFYSTVYSNVPQAVAQIPWGHNRLIIGKIKSIEEAIIRQRVCICRPTVQN